MESQQKRPNIVVITADQWRGDCVVGREGLHGRGTRHPVMTPHVNQLAAEGARFTQAYADCPVCMPQRVTMLTGQVASRFGLPGNFGVRSPISLQASLPAQLARRGGYQTKAIGKMHFLPDRARMGFEHVSLHPDDYVNWLEETPYAGMYRGHGLGGNEVYPVTAPMPQRFTHTSWIVEQSIRFLVQRDPEHPFFLWMVFESPHSPFDPPAPFDRMYDNFTIPDPIRGEWVDGPDDPVYFRAKRLVGKWAQLSDEVIAESRRFYYGLMSHIDYELGRFLGELRSKGLYDDTAIIFNSDHGEHLGDHGLFGKTTFLSGSGDVPFIVRLPSGLHMAEPTLELDTPILTADLYPTVLELAGLQPETVVDGMSLLPSIQSGQMPARTVCGECSHGDDATAFATDGRYKYIYYYRGGVEQLLDVVKDWENRYSLAGRAEYAEPLQRLRKHLIDYLASHGRPLVVDGEFAIGDDTLDEKTLHARNPWAWRGPMRYGQGYGGGW